MKDEIIVEIINIDKHNEIQKAYDQLRKDIYSMIDKYPDLKFNYIKPHPLKADSLHLGLFKNNESGLYHLTYAKDMFRNHEVRDPIYNLIHQLEILIQTKQNK